MRIKSLWLCTSVTTYVFRFPVFEVCGPTAPSAIVPQPRRPSCPGQLQQPRRSRSPRPRLTHQLDQTKRAGQLASSGSGSTGVAEGVETAEHVALLREMGCDLLQGYFFARPLPIAQLRAMLESSARIAMA